MFQLNGFIFRPMDAPHARQVLQWKYDPPYDSYNFHEDQIELGIRYLLDPANAYFTLHNLSGTLVAYCCYGADAQVPGGDYELDALDVGLGMRPDLTGKGNGIIYVQSVLDYARQTYHPARFRVTIAEFNLRAQRTWQKAGFRQVMRFRRFLDGKAFVILLRDEDQTV